MSVHCPRGFCSVSLLSKWKWAFLFFFPQRKETKKCAVVLFHHTNYMTTILWSRNHANVLQNAFSILTLLGYVTCLTNIFGSSAPLKYAICSFCSWLCGTCYCLMWSLAQIFPVCSDTAVFSWAFISGCCCPVSFKLLPLLKVNWSWYY